MNNNSKNSRSLFDELKRKERVEKDTRQVELDENGEKILALDDTERVKVLSPGRLVSKRFFRNKLAIIGLAILIFMFMFSFLGPLFYPYSQTQIFYKYAYLNTNYASATERTENTVYSVPGAPAVKSAISNRFNSYISELEAAGISEKAFAGTDGAEYIVTKIGDRIYTLSAENTVEVGTYRQSAEIGSYDRLLKTFEWTGAGMSSQFEETVLLVIANGEQSFVLDGTNYTIATTKTKYMITCTDAVMDYAGADLGAGFTAAVEGAIGADEFEYSGKSYRLHDNGNGSFTVAEIGESSAALIASTYVFNAFETGRSFSDEFKISALFALCEDGTFEADGISYTVRISDDDIVISDAAGQEVAAMSIFAVRRYSGQDTLPIDFKEAVQDVILSMNENKTTSATFTYELPAMDESANYLYDENGTPIFTETKLDVIRKNTGEYVLSCDQMTYLIDIFAAPSSDHVFGTDGDGMDILARMMYGGRISLMVGFVVVFLEIILGVMMGGTSGFFGGWVDSLIMRIADIFYCIPSYPILIIMGALFDKIKMGPYQRLIWMMVMLGILGWAGIARLVRGQILSLREQEFMVAQEATGIKARRRIFRHLVPNVMPQLIVTATMGVGSVIIYESTLSFLGLGVKHPLATWGTMINAVTGSAEDMIKYTYIWIPVGLLICLTVIAFNFVGDGLRDAFDPKMKR